MKFKRKNIQKDRVVITLKPDEAKALENKIGAIGEFGTDSLLWEFYSNLVKAVNLRKGI